MLKIVKASFLLTAASLLLPASASQAGIGLALQNICHLVESNDKEGLKRKIKKVQSTHRLKLQDYYHAVTCNGDSLIRTAFKHDAYETGAILVKKMPKCQLNTPEPDGKTLRAWVSEQGMMKSELALVLNDRI